MSKRLKAPIMRVINTLSLLAIVIMFMGNIQEIQAFPNPFKMAKRLVGRVIHGPCTCMQIPPVPCQNDPLYASFRKFVRRYAKKYGCKQILPPFYSSMGMRGMAGMMGGMGGMMGGMGGCGCGGGGMGGMGGMMNPMMGMGGMGGCGMGMGGMGMMNPMMRMGGMMNPMMMGGMGGMSGCGMGLGGMNPMMMGGMGGRGPLGFGVLPALRRGMMGLRMGLGGGMNRMGMMGGMNPMMMGGMNPMMMGGMNPMMMGGMNPMMMGGMNPMMMRGMGGMGMMSPFYSSLALSRYLNHAHLGPGFGPSRNSRRCKFTMKKAMYAWARNWTKHHCRYRLGGLIGKYRSTPLWGFNGFNMAPPLD